MKQVLIIENDLFFSSKITATLLQLGYKSLVAHKPAEVRTLLKQGNVALVILDLLIDGLDTITLVEELKSNPSLADIPVIAFAEHTETELLHKAREGGCEIVVSNRGIVKDLKDLVEASLA